MQMPLNQRQQQIMDRLTSDGEVKLSELKEMFDVTEMTLRRDLEKLEQLGSIRRIFGGAILVGKDIALHERTGVLTDEKARIGSKVAQLLRPNDSIFIDGGSTTLQISKYLRQEMNLTVVTNAINIAQELHAKRISTILLGGVLLEQTATLIGPIAIENIARMAFDRVFLGATGLSDNHGFSNSNMYESEIKRLAITQSKEVNIVMDHTKFGTQGLFSFATLAAADRIVTDRLPDSSTVAACLEHGVEIVIS
ncbi:DeoR/GlpR family DNA-binding transcription regulator [Cohnella abietis]|uniref:DeoR family transcriptional regulator n=1 Tax=Cohnella abietis TaxID=2507935 RepID=A0A3T1D462_9BACL|nr:DeoR/GlpR family DNA-binding transcription regulator [Cohnella abietis]BBI32900.1 DeoR family transcriptional regulator [Cohnella abietis]